MAAPQDRLPTPISPNPLGLRGPRQVEGLWFDDGRTVLQAGQKLFRLHNGLLERHSPVFRNILAQTATDISDDVPGVSSGRLELMACSNPNSDLSFGCPLIRMGDSADDAECFFRAIYDIGYFERPPAQTTLPIILSILKLSTKYKIDNLRQRALAHLGTGYPHTLHGWDLRKDQATFPIHRVYGQNSHTLQDTLSVIQVCTEVGATWVLPAALYELCNYELQIILSHPIWSSKFNERLRKTVLCAYVKQMEAQRGVVGFLTGVGVQGCENSEGCGEVKRQWMSSALIWGLRDPLDVWEKEDWESFREDVCGVCGEGCWGEYVRERRGIWEGLPRLYDLGKWGDLLYCCSVAMGVEVDLEGLEAGA